MCVLQFYLQSDRVNTLLNCNPCINTRYNINTSLCSCPHSFCRYVLLGPIVIRFLTNLSKHAYAVIQHKLANQSIRDRRAHLMNSSSQGDLWDDVPFERIVPGNIVKVQAGEYAFFALLVLVFYCILLASQVRTSRHGVVVCLETAKSREPRRV